MREQSVDIAIVGGGIAGLWLYHRARALGFSAVVLESQALGAGQTVASQGMIHGGVKYTLSGMLSGASEAIADMPAHWRRCLHGEGDVDISGATILSDHFYMWSSASALSKVTTFFASKALRGRVDQLSPRDYPQAFQQRGFKGTVYKLVDLVLDVPSLLVRLARDAAIVAVDWQQARWQQGATTSLALDSKHNISAKRWVLAAGLGNEALLQSLGAMGPAMQRRPLQQVMVRHPQLTPLYAHCVGTDSKPRLTISSHQTADGTVWYLGGQLAEEGVALSSAQLIAKAYRELSQLMPWINWRDAQWAAHEVVRAEPAQPGGVRPDNAWLSSADGVEHVLVAWPTKLTLVPNLGDLLANHLQSMTPEYAQADWTDFPRCHTVQAAPWHEASWQPLPAGV